ncbi:helix-turn-helix transcriptional regulator [Agrilactobacillus yilanensis]|uniref:Helix-turn-helix transcriptional regulator n=1 Tax=Agrilactobacillus yilanensis TaxID=2485997 RepID=A0ABW4J8M9_9LACO|nr:helix-turn-helix transcriptional regulator [Agrilactobacillus yilanensis]
MQHALGEILKQARLTQHLSQKQVAENICSQPTISAIERNCCTPNAKLLIALCRRLTLEVAQIDLAQPFNISNNLKIERTLSQLCEQHNYKDLYQFLTIDQTINSIQTATQLQAYYYYLGIAKFQLNQSLPQVEQSWQLSLANAPMAANLSTLSRLTYSSLACISAKRGLNKQAQQRIYTALADLTATAYDENQNICFYLTALTCYQLHDFIGSLQLLDRGIQFTSAHDSQYLLANYYCLVAQILDAQEHHNLKKEALQQEQLLFGLLQQSSDSL